MAKWEYKAWKINLNQVKSVGDELDKLGMDGWELISVTLLQWKSTKSNAWTETSVAEEYSCFFKRQIA